MDRNKIDTVLNKLPLEALIWLSALIALACVNPVISHFTLCPLKNLGIVHCPGCGLGTSVSLVLHGEVQASFQAHPLGIFALIVLSFRIVKLFYVQYFK